MALRTEYSLGHSEFNEFLFSFVGKEKSGQQLTVLSALARLGLDPWGEAARLSELSAEKATRALAAAIAGLPEGDWKESDLRSIAMRLVNSLPKHGSPSAGPAHGRSIENQKPKSQARKWMVWGALAAAVFIVVLRLHAS